MEQNLRQVNNDPINFGQNSLYISPILINDSISLNSLFILLSRGTGSKTVSISIGLYSLTGSTFSLANSGSRSLTFSGGQLGYQSITNFSATQNISAGNWYFGIIKSTHTGGVNDDFSFYGASIPVNINNAFPGKIIGGILTVTTGALPVSVATSGFDITGTDEHFVPYILINA